MENQPFYIVDVFAEDKYEGNQLAVFSHAADLSPAEMQKIARETNFSETTFVRSSEKLDGGYDVRIFTPAEEIPFAGHPTLGTAFVIQQELIGQPVAAVHLNLKVGQIPVSFSYQNDKPVNLWMRQNEPVFGKRHDPAATSWVLGLDDKELDNRYPIEEVSTGLPFIIVPLKNLDSIKRIEIDQNKYFDMIKDGPAKAILTFCPETYDFNNVLNVRVFVGYYGIPEDPATGSANGCLAGYLVKHLYFDKPDIDIRVEQGYEIGRPSLLHLRSKVNQGVIDVAVGGNVIKIAQGEFV